MDISMERMGRDAVQVRSQPEGNKGTVVIVIDLAREPGGTVGAVDRWKVLLKAQSFANAFLRRLATTRPHEGPHSLDLAFTELRRLT